jgi:hypothetical protein
MQALAGQFNATHGAAAARVEDITPAPVPASTKTARRLKMRR